MSTVALETLNEKLSNLHGTSAADRHKLRDLLMEAIHSDDARVRATAAEALGRIGDDRAVAPLTSALLDPDQVVRWRAGHALYALHEQALVAPHRLGITDKRDFEGWKSGLLAETAAMLGDPDSATRLKAAGALRIFGAPETVPSLLLGLFDENVGVRAEALLALSEITRQGPLPLEQATAYLVAALHDGDPAVRRTAADALGTLGGLGAAAALAPLLHDPDPSVRASSAVMLGRLRDSAAARGLVSCLADDDPTVRRNAAWALGEIGDRHSVAALTQLRNDEDTLVRRAVDEALARLSSGGSRH